ncbi:Com family DNA-binding transcriptional regulator [Maridesulfovibrio sp.]|uniref:Com family DNA-binding transcriptional regulator n=1 Tax=Maridesulfovibrio sp. TaxID=2795000 RepID=UPI0039EEFAB0
MRKNEFRCGKCNKLLATGIGNLTIKCPRCGTLNHLRAMSTNPNGETVMKERTHEERIPPFVTKGTGKAR